MKQAMVQILGLLRGNPQAERAVPPTGFTARLTLFTAAAMAFLAAVALALSLAADRVADRWAEELAQTSTLRISAPEDQRDAQVRAAINVLQTTPGIAEARVLSSDEQTALLAPWFGPDLPLEALNIPQLIEIIEDGEGYDPIGLRARLQAEVPAAVLDDHARWREPLVAAANRLRLVGWGALVLIVAAATAMVTLAAQSALAANAQDIGVLRLVGATDTYIARAFVRRFTLRSFWGAILGTLLGCFVVLTVPDPSAAGFGIGLAPVGLQWFWPLLIPVFAAIVGFWATRAAALRTLRAET